MTAILAQFKINGQKDKHTKGNFVGMSSGRGKWLIPKEELDSFYSEYAKDIKHNKKKHYLTEPTYKDTKATMLAIDLDFHYHIDHEERLYQMDSVKLFCKMLLRTVKAHFGVDTFCVIMEKEHPVIESTCVHDGIHIAFPDVTVTPEWAEWLKLYRKGYLIEYFPFIGEGKCVNGVDDIWDIPSGWTVYGSVKNGKALPYLITKTCGQGGKTFEELTLKEQIVAMRYVRKKSQVLEDEFTDVEYKRKYMKWKDERDDANRKREEGEGNDTAFVEGENDGDIKPLLVLFDGKRYNGTKDGWIKVLSAIKNSGGSLELANWWSKQDPVKDRYKGLREVEEAWERITAKDANIGTLHWMAKNDDRKGYEKANVTRWDKVTHSDWMEFKMRKDLRYTDIMNFVKVNVRRIANGGSSNSFYMTRQMSKDGNLQWVSMKAGGNVFEYNEMVKLFDGKQVNVFKMLKGDDIRYCIEYSRKGFIPFSPLEEVVVPRHVFNQFFRYRGELLEEVDMEKIEPILFHLKEVWCNGDDAKYDWLMAWFADIVQHPRAECKKGTAIVIKSKQGGGKGMLLEFLKNRVIGSEYVHVQANMQSMMRFNTTLENNILTAFEELKGEMSAFQYSGMLKDMITRTEMDSEAKFKEKVLVEDCNRYLFFTNDSHPVVIDNSDRRYLVLEASSKYTKDHEYFNKLENSMNQEAGDNFLTYLLNYDCSVIGNGLRRALCTEEKTEMKLEQAPNWVKFFVDLRESRVQFDYEQQVEDLGYEEGAIFNGNVLDMKVNGTEEHKVFEFSGEKLFQLYREWANAENIHKTLPHRTFMLKVRKELGMTYKRETVAQTHDGKRRLLYTFSVPILSKLMEKYVDDKNLEFE